MRNGREQQRPDPGTFPGESDAGGTNQLQQNGASNDSAPAGSASPLPAVSLPKGGGAIRGIGEKFGVNPVTGTGALTVPIATSPGRSGFGPQLSLAYDSGAGNGCFGFGWGLSLPSITRKADKRRPGVYSMNSRDPNRNC